ncbi:hypothetical protein [Tenacibaculum finnmarkense]|uniref:hypothetical protein n=1 Tax=Tenacibaculum finnmarkense TaxID=2781243 RepID=UPI00207AFBDC|nr:hypothetical protein [Tenacibaculum finnmarkense]MCM8906803.1 hypothetical protein [Tenacibaculum finnmarkense genomovar finnmarkense]
MTAIRYKGKGEHSVNELELIIEQKMEELYLINSGQKQLRIGGVIVPKGTLVCENCTHFEVCNKQHRTVQTCGYYKE